MVKIIFVAGLEGSGAGFLECQYMCLDLTFIDHFSGSAVTDDAQVLHGYYVERNIITTMIRNSNVIMLSVAFGIAASLKVDLDPLYDGAVYFG